MKEIWIAYDHSVKKIFNMIKSEPVTLADAQKTVARVSSNKAKTMSKTDGGKNCQQHLYC